MVQLEETPDEHFRRAPTDAEEWEDEEDDASDVSSVADSDDEVLEETLGERLAALKDIVPPTTRAAISNTTSSIVNTTWALGTLAGRAAWVLTTSALLVGLPFALAVEDEARFAMQEREMNAQSSGASAMLGSAPGAPALPGAPGAPPVPHGQQPQEGLRPPGF